MLKRIVVVVAVPIAAVVAIVATRSLGPTPHTSKRVGMENLASADTLGPNDDSPEWIATNFPIPSESARGNHCPSTDVPEGSDESFDPESGRIKINFYDSAFQADRSFILDVRDPACYETRASRRHIFWDLVDSIGIYLTADSNTACDRLRDAIRSGSLKLGEKPFDMKPAQPYVDEVCKPR